MPFPGSIAAPSLVMDQWQPGMSVLDAIEKANDVVRQQDQAGVSLEDFNLPASSPDPQYSGIANTDNVQAAMADFGLSAADAMKQNQLFNAAEAEKQREAAFELVKYQLDRQEDFSKNAVQYRMEDLKKAGINPILAFQGGGAQLPSSASAGLSAASSTYQGGDTASTMIKAFAEYGNYYAKMIEAIAGAVNGLIGNVSKFLPSQSISTIIKK